MGDMGDLFNAWKASRKADKADNLRHAEASFDALTTEAHQVVRRTEWHWTIWPHERSEPIHYYPSTRKWSEWPPHQKKRLLHGTFEDFINRVRKLRDALQ